MAHRVPARKLAPIRAKKTNHLSLARGLIVERFVAELRLRSEERPHRHAAGLPMLQCERHYLAESVVPLHVRRRHVDQLPCGSRGRLNPERWRQRQTRRDAQGHQNFPARRTVIDPRCPSPTLSHGILRGIICEVVVSAAPVESALYSTLVRIGEHIGVADGSCRLGVRLESLRRGELASQFRPSLLVVPRWEHARHALL
mmetsp:Transcript_52978/g.147536  ORF Transcript_52978/g.147536 Transcript_52978/m.147536 type:complete len:200 (-) Transcript_52978:2501-3100(-)